MTVPTSGHTLKKFDEDLATLRDLVLRMGGSVEEQVRRAVEAVERDDPELAREVVEGDREIDRMELQADEEVAHVLALRSPLGVDLRTVLMLSKTVNDLERVGDEAKKIAKIAIRLHGGDEGGRAENVPMLADVSTLARRALAMLHGALEALVRLDLEQARALSAEDDALDAIYKAAIGRLKGWMAEHPEGVEAAVQVLFALKGLERIGDHSGNIAEYVFYLVEGRDVRHPKSNPAFSGGPSTG